MAAKVKVRTRNNYFNTLGAAILLESDGEKWFESGAVSNVEIKDNTFERCRYTKSNWGEYVIELKPREEFREGEFYHKRISITENRFVSCDSPLLYADNVAEIVFRNNSEENCETDKSVEFINYGRIECN